MKKVVVTGANGFVGSALVKELVNKGIKVIAVIRNEQSDYSCIDGLPNIRIVYCSLDEIKRLSEKIFDRDIDAFYHFAWEGSAGSLRSSYELQLKNAQYSCDVVKVCQRIGCKRFVFAGSIMEYECAQLMETSKRPSQVNIYCAAKIAANYMARTVATEMGVEYVVGVISNIYGVGEISPRLVNTTLRKFLSGEKTSFTSGEQMYDFIYITDAAKAFYAIGKYGQSNKNYYIGSLEPKPLKDFLMVMRDEVNSMLTLNLGEIQFNGISLDYSMFDLQAVKKDTGFVPEISFADGIERTIEWLKSVERY